MRPSKSRYWLGEPEQANLACRAGSSESGFKVDHLAHQVDLKRSRDYMNMMRYRVCVTVSLVMTEYTILQIILSLGNCGKHLPVKNAVYC